MYERELLLILLVLAPTAILVGTWTRAGPDCDPIGALTFRCNQNYYNNYHNGYGYDAQVCMTNDEAFVPLARLLERNLPVLQHAREQIVLAQKYNDFEGERVWKRELHALQARAIGAVSQRIDADTTWRTEIQDALAVPMSAPLKPKPKKTVLGVMVCTLTGKWC